MKILRSKKGAALVAVLIGILFISILASSLLYMSTMNLQMKSMRQISQDNFYTAEYALDDMLAQLKQYSSVQAKPYDNLDTYLRKPATVGGMTVFDESKLQAMVNISSYVPGLDPSFGTNGVEVTSVYKKSDGTYTCNTYEKTDNFIYLRGVQITVKTDEAHGNYKSTITTDICFGFPQGASGSAGLNDFSVLMDSPIFVNGGSPNFCSDVYCRANNYNKDGVNMGRNALRVGNAGICSLLGEFSFLQGDVTVEGGGSLFVGGDCYVNGDVSISTTGQLIVAGRLMVRGKITGTPTVSGGTVLKDEWPRDTDGTWKTAPATSKTNVKWDFYDTKFSSGLAGQLVNDKMYIHSDSSHNSVYKNGTETYPGDSSKLELTQKEFAYMVGGGGILTTGTRDGITANAWYLTNGVTNKTLENTLIVSPFSPTSYHGSMKNCTWLCTCDDGILKIDAGTDNYLQVWGAMDDKSYEVAKSLFFQASPNQKINNVEYSGSKESTSVNGESALKVYNTKDISDPIDGDSTKRTLGGTTIHMFANNGEGLANNFYYKDGDEKINYLAFNCFFAKNMTQTLKEFKSESSDSSDPGAKPTIILNHWTKE